MKKNSINNITKGLYDEVKDVIENVKFDKSENALEFLKGVKLSEGLKPIKELKTLVEGVGPLYILFESEDLYCSNEHEFFGLLKNNNDGDSYYCSGYYYLDDEGFISDANINFLSTNNTTYISGDDYIEELKLTTKNIHELLFKHNIFISGLARNKNINVSFQIYSTISSEAASITNLVDLIGKNTKIAVNGYHEDLGVIIAGVTVNSNNELTFVGVNSSATSIAWSEISDVTITDSIQQL